MKLPNPSDLDFDKVLRMVAAHARTGVGRDLLLQCAPTQDQTQTLRLGRLTREMEELIAVKGQLSLAGIDDALPWLAPQAPPPHEIKDLLALLGLARRVAGARRRLLAAGSELELLGEIAATLPDTSELVEWAASRIGRDGQVPDDASPRLAGLRRQQVRARHDILQQLEEIRRASPQAATGDPPTLRRDRYCLPVRTGGQRQLGGLVLSSSDSGATVYVEPFALVELNNNLVDSTAQEAEEVRRIFAEVATAFAAVSDDLAAAIDVLALLDAAQARALFGRSAAGRVVLPGGGQELILCQARHPLLDPRLRGLRDELFDDEERRDPGRKVVPLNFRLPPDVRTLVISGPNAGGKTVVLKTIGLMVLMANQGIPLPVDEGTVIPSYRHLWCHIGDEQDVAADLSTFSGAMAATAGLLDQAGEHSLVLYDELGAGTDPLEGAALGWALLEELTRRCGITVCTTHLAAIALSATAAAGMDNAAMEYDEEAGCPTYWLRIGRPGRSRGLEIAHTMGIPDTLLERARELLGGQHLELDRWLRRLETVETELIQERTELERERITVHKLQRELQGESERLRSEREQLPVTLSAERDRLRQRAKGKLDVALARLDAATRDQRPLGRRQRQRLRDEALDLPQPETRPPAQETPPELSPGMAVRLAGLKRTGTLVSERGSRALVAVAGKRMWIARDDLQPIKGEAAPPTSKLEVTTGDPGQRELVLIGKDSEGARDELEHFLDRAWAAGQTMVRVVHGHGTGTLRRMVNELCRSHPAVRSFRHPPGHLGGTGATEVKLGSDD